ncbi:hypothetical protein THRCLA_01478 [Thraustotheca clavata]|uniref:Tetraspanin n=1 Tax=Thraustotheca clavata TaxID=74557 RepID=A0A1W0A853_9STRA|nr:hypothetical protein THRCLA_01478 [Thraustotheca clavata]
MKVFAKENLVRNMYGVCFGECILALFLFIVGVVMSQSTHYILALGKQFAAVAGGFIFIGICYGLIAIFAYCGGRHQNKFLLLVHLVGVGLLSSFQGLTALSGLLLTIPDYSYAFQETCLTNYYLNNATLLLQCTPYFQSEMYNNLRASWRSYYSDNVADPTQSTGIQRLQDTSICCGFGPPNHCMNDTNPLSSSDNTPHQICPRNYINLYPKTPFCYLDGACSFDEPIGTCGANGAGKLSKGCASAFHLYHASTLQSICVVVLISLFIPSLGGCNTICLCFKRKNEDVIPTSQHISVRPSIQTKIYCQADVIKAEMDF